jgi:alpha-beta hydrolase superfamily lysophospholipase
MEYQKKTGRFPSRMAGEIVTYYVYIPAVEEPRGILQIAHGMCEYVERYEPFIEFMMEQGWIVCGNDHLGHGRTATDESKYGYMGGADGWKIMVKDMHTLARRMQQLRPGLPYFLLAHSMGSFLGRAYVTQYGDELDGAIIMGTSDGIGLIPSLAALGIIEGMSLIKGDHYRSEFLQKMVFGSYNQRITDPATPSDWLSRDPAVVEKYVADPLCTFTFTLSGFRALMLVLKTVSSAKWAGTVKKELPILIVSGAEDPVGSYGAGPEKVAKRLIKAGVQDVTLLLYPEYRHEPLNEIGREQVYEALIEWLEERSGKEESC